MENVTTVYLGWEKTNLSTMHLLGETYFYALTRGDNLLYVGKSEYTFLKAEIRQNLKRLDISNTGLVIWIGFVERDKTTIKRMTSEIIDDVESLLIYKLHTHYNEKKTKTYRGRVPLRVINDYCPILPRQITITKNTPLNR